MTEWQPIETAPKDGFALVWRKGWDRPYITNITTRRRPWGSGGDLDPTHWQPLPEPPSDG